MGITTIGDEIRASHARLLTSAAQRAIVLTSSKRYPWFVHEARQDFSPPDVVDQEIEAALLGPNALDEHSHLILDGVIDRGGDAHSFNKASVVKICFNNVPRIHRYRRSF